MTLNEREACEGLAMFNEDAEKLAHENWYKSNDPIAYKFYRDLNPEFETDFYTSEKAWLARAKAQALPVWVSTNFMLPDDGELVLGISTTKLAKFNVYQVVAMDEFEECGINYWMPLPDGPSESGAEP